MLEEKLDTLTKEIVALRQAIEANGTGAAAAPAKAPAKAAGKKAAEPEHDADEVGAAMRAAAKLNKPVVQAYIKKAKCADLAELLTKPELLDKAFDFAATVEAPEDEDDDV